MKVVIETLRDNIRWAENFISDKGRIPTEQEKELKLKQIEQFKKAIKILEESELQKDTEHSEQHESKALNIADVSKRFYIGCEVSLKSNKYSNGIIINTARKRQGSTYWEVEWYDGEITKVRENTLNVC